jgi:hypothetical protein
MKGHETHRLYLNGISHSRCNMPAGITTTLEKCTRVEVTYNDRMGGTIGQVVRKYMAQNLHARDSTSKPSS